MHKKICLIIPCYNEKNRLNLASFRKHSANCLFLFVDDGSKDGTAELLNSAMTGGMSILKLATNVGKAAAVREAMLYALSSQELSDADWFGYWDADLATPLGELAGFIAFSELTNGRVDAVFGSRILRLGSDISRLWSRHLLGRFFATMAGLLLGIRSYDSQCGAKLFRREIVDHAFSKPFLSKWLFDIEIIIRLEEYKVIEYPLTTWHDIAGSKVRVVRDLPQTIIDLVKIGLRYDRIRLR